MGDSSSDIFEERFAEVDALFDAVLGCEPGRRIEFLREACGDDLELFAAVEQLLVHVGPSKELFDRNPSDDTWSLALEEWRPEPELGPGDVLGAFRLVREIDRGGMGTIFEAERCDDQFRQRVALKVLRRGFDTADIVQRFMAERQILASLGHRHIARVLDGGETPDGRPFFVMELVQGDPILEYCDRRKMSVADRLRLFLEVAGAVEHAHRKLVIHRDLKPSNVLVTDEGDVKLLDFGIAKILDPSDVPSSTPVTKDGSMLLTLGYASPEQARGTPITTACDVYQLGLLLHELLTGLPVHPRNDVEALAWVLSDEEAPAPSSLLSRARRKGDEASVARARRRGTEPRGLRRRLRGDLDAIVLTAVRKDPDRRYGSVEALARDVRRHLTGRPISARRDSPAYRLAKFVRRNRPLSAAVALLAVLLVGYVVTLRHQARVLKAERTAAEVEARKAERVRDFLVGTFQLADPLRAGSGVTVEKLLDMAARRIRAGLAGQPGVQTEMLGVIGTVYHNLSMDQESQAFLEEAVDIWERTGSDSTAIAPSLALLGERMDATFHPDSAEALYRRAVSVAQGAQGPLSPLAGRMLAAWAAHEGSDPPRETVLADSAVAILRRYPDRSADLADALLAGEGLPDGGRRIREALRLREEAFGENSVQVAWTLNDLGLSLQNTNPDSAEILIRRALDIHRRAVGERQRTTLTIMNNLAGLLRDQGRCEEAEGLYRNLLRVRRQEAPYDELPIAYVEYGLGWCLGETGQTEEAERLLRKVVQTFPGKDERGNRARAVLGHVLALAGRRREAEQLLSKALQEARGRPRVSTGEEAFVLTRLEDLYRRTNRTDEAEAMERRLQELRASTAQPPP